MNRTARRLTTTFGATAGSLALLTGTALAHTCYLGTPTTKAPQSDAWIVHPMWELASFVVEGYDTECADVEAGNAALREAGLPLSIRIFASRHLAAGAPAHALSNGKGMESFDHALPMDAVLTFADAAMAACGPA